MNKQPINKHWQKGFVLGSVLFAGAVSAIALYIPRPIPTATNLSIPFSTQAPTGNWLNNENCEETSATMAAAFLYGNHDEKLLALYTQQHIDKLIAWENQHLQYNTNTGADDTAKMAEAVLGVKTHIITNFTKDDLKQALAAGHPILLPLNAQLLAPDNYPDLHPTYHMVVMRGYDGDRFFINDPGASTGQNNSYTFEEMQKASADWSHSENRIVAEKIVAIVVEK